MKAFKFTLQSLLNVKNTVEKQQKAELAAANLRLQALEQELAVLRRSLSAQQNDYVDQMQASGMRPPDLSVWITGFDVMRDRIAEQLHKIEVAQDEVRRIQRKVVEVMKERKMLEKLKEKQREEYRALQRAEDAEAIGEFVANKIHQGG